MIFKGLSLMQIKTFFLEDESSNLKVKYVQSTETATKGVLYKKVFLEISQNSQENTCARVFFLIKLQALCLQLY